MNCFVKKFFLCFIFSLFYFGYQNQSDITKASEKREEVLILKEEQQEKIQAVQTEYLNKISGYQEKYRALLQELEEFKAADRK